MEARDLRRMTVEEYITLDRASDERWEYVNGAAFAMAGGSPENALVATNAALALRNAASGSSRRVCARGPSSSSRSARRSRSRSSGPISIDCADP
ncbi:Uma2 family endonuclease [Sandaracinus amylolyticus]|uniref:Uma2 family endonuclease n=1 Tax=Sandaracinus amylolyticus TaxID=927083 RepID=UPI001F288768|nr:Uma2 family endonuclease [Sandaracinus amylolyticus]